MLLEVNAAETAVSTGEKTNTGIMPVSKLFHGIGKNVVDSIFFNNGLYFITAMMGTYVMIDSGFDWHYNRAVYSNQTLIYSSYPALFIGYIMPFALPVSFYLFGRDKRDQKLQTAGLALGQSLLLSIAYSYVLKCITGRISPGIADVLDHKRSYNTADYSNQFDWGFGKRGFIAGWPSGHAMNAFAFAAVMSEIYHDNVLVKVVSYSYAVFIGLGVSWCVHWPSEVFAGALIGYAIGKTVGGSFSRLLNNKQDDTVALYVTANMIGIRISI
ncbi:MAG: phosphatase PAP2 family protein [Spirochaetaceae bacterium]|jgi:membrane-associated phospholipid phosphatase|nr:phosphatase PAP2 family protein [Spirochaetaceae bacterium]